jgi:hypothetical protein
MVIGDEDGTSLDRGVDPVLKEWRRLWNVAAMWFGSAPAMERRGESGGGVQVGFKPMTPHSFSSAPAGSADFGGCYPLLSPTSFDWQLWSDGAIGGLEADMEFEQQQFEDFFSGLEKIGEGHRRKSAASLCRRSHCVGGGGLRVAARFRSPSESGLTAKIGAYIGGLLLEGAFSRRLLFFFLDTGSYQGPAGDARAMIKRPT